MDTNRTKVHKRREVFKQNNFTPLELLFNLILNLKSKTIIRYLWIFLFYKLIEFGNCKFRGWYQIQSDNYKIWHREEWCGIRSFVYARDLSIFDDDRSIDHQKLLIFSDEFSFFNIIHDKLTLFPKVLKQFHNFSPQFHIYLTPHFSWDIKIIIKKLTRKTWKN